MEIKNKTEGHNGAFYMEDAGKEIGLMHYQMQGEDKMIIDHTEVKPEYEGKGLGGELIKAGVEYARQHHIKILPLCPFAKKVFNITPDYADVLY